MKFISKHWLQRVALCLFVFVVGLLVSCEPASTENVSQAVIEKVYKVAQASDIYFDNAGNMFVATRQNRIIKFNSKGESSLFAELPCSELLCMEVDKEGNIYASGRDKVLKIDPKGNVTVFAEDFQCADDLRFDGAGNLYIMDADSNCVYRFSPSGEKTLFIANDLSEPLYGSWYMTGMVFSPDYKYLYIARYNRNQFVRYAVNPDGTAGPQEIFADGLQTPDHCEVDANGNVYLTLYMSGEVVKFTPSGEKTTLVPAGKFSRATNIVFSKKGYHEFYIALVAAGEIVKVTLPQ